MKEGASGALFFLAEIGAPPIMAVNFARFDDRDATLLFTRR
jgi:hypothetical protein